MRLLVMPGPGEAPSWPPPVMRLALFSTAAAALPYLQEFEHQVVAAYIERETARQEALSAQRLREARNMWARLIQAVRVRLQLRNSYEEEGPGGTADAPAGPQERQGAGGGCGAEYIGSPGMEVWS